MKLYHGSTLEISHPDVRKSRRNLDFGQGFYLTSIKKQAERWALRKAALEGTGACVSIFDFDEHAADLTSLEFSNNDDAWVEFVCHCRKGGQSYLQYDLVVGGVADDKVYEAVNMYFRGYWDMETTLSALRFYERSDQYCFVSQRAVDYALTFIESYEVHP